MGYFVSVTGKLIQVRTQKLEKLTHLPRSYEEKVVDPRFDHGLFHAKASKSPPCAMRMQVGRWQWTQPLRLGRAQLKLGSGNRRQVLKGQGRIDWRLVGT